MNVPDVNPNDKLLVSKISKVSIFLTSVGYVFPLVVARNRALFPILTSLTPLIIMISLVGAIILSIIDLTKKKRKKTLSIISLVLSSLYFLFVIVAALLLVLTAKRG
jgi:tellurite resistance protein TehA-like permease